MIRNRIFKNFMMSYQIWNSIRNSSASFMVSPLGNFVSQTETSLLIVSEILGTCWLYFFNPSNIAYGPGKSRASTGVPFKGVIVSRGKNLKNSSDASENFLKCQPLSLRSKTQKSMLTLMPRVIVCENLLKIRQNQNQEPRK